MISRRSFVQTIACFVALSAMAVHAAPLTDVVFGNLGASGTAALSDTNTDFGAAVATKALAQGFTTGASNEFLTLQSIALGLFNDETPNVRTVSIYSNNSGNPGAPLYTSSSQAVTTAGVYTFSFANQQLDPNTTYWIVPEGPASWYINLDETQPTGQNGSGYSYFGTVRSTTGASGPWVSSSLQYSVSIQAVPEPSTYAMAAIGAGVAGLMSWRRRKIAAAAV